MYALTDSQINEIAQELEIGFTCYWNPNTNELLFIPDENQFGFEPEPWAEATTVLNTNRADWETITPPTSHESFGFMADFVDSLPDKLRLKQVLDDALGQSKPFRRFKDIVDNAGPLREQWFAFRDQKMREWVREEVERIMGDK